MYGGSSKLGGRGGGRGGGGGAAPKRLSSSFPPPPPLRPSNPTSRLSIGGSSNPRSNNNNNNNNRPSAAATKPPASAGGAGVEESFSLVPGNNPLAFAMIIRLAPDLVEEIKRVEAQGGTARIKFDSVPTNQIGNVIDVGGKEFRFTWSRELGDLCDIYEEHQSGEDGNGLLVESGGAWRKVNVQRILDESIKNHVKMRSEEAERKHKSRKAIVLDPGNPSMKSQIKQLAAVEANPWRMPFKPKKEPPFKKRKVEPPQVSGPPKSTFKSGLPSSGSAKGRTPSSPLPSPPEQSGAPASPYGTGSFPKGQLSTEEIAPIQTKSKENAAITEKEIPTMTTSAVQETPRRKWNFGAESMDLESMLITLLIDNPKGMRLKDLEKAVGDTIPNSAKKIEPIIKKIATFQAPGKYVLKHEVELEILNKPLCDSGSSPEDHHQQTQVPEDKHDKKSAPEPRFSEKNHVIRLDEQAQSDHKLGEESNASEKFDIPQQSPDLFGEKKVSDNSEGKVGSSSDSGSDSDSESDSSDSGSDSGSRSKTRSPAGSGSGSSSDSDTDASSNSKEGSDEDVDIMTSDDEKEPPQKLQPSEPAYSVLPDPRKSVPNGTDEKQDGDGSDAVAVEGDECAAIDIEGHESDAIDIGKHFDEKEVEMAANDNPVAAEEAVKPVNQEKSFSPHHILAREAFIGNLFDDNETLNKEFIRLEQSDSSEVTSKAQPKMGPDMRHFDEKSEGKKFKAESLAKAPISRGRDAPVSRGRDALYSEGPHNRHIEDTYKGPANQVMNRADREGHSDFGSQKGNNPAFHGKSSSDFKQSGRSSSDQSIRAKAIDSAGRPKHVDSLGHCHKFSEKGTLVHDDFLIQKEKASRDIQKEDNFVKEKSRPRNLNEGGAGGRHSVPSDSHYRKQGEILGKFKDPAQVSISQMGLSPMDINKVDMDKHPIVSGRGLQRELSDLELGELREPLPEEPPVKKQFERKSSFKQSENKQSSSDYYITDLSKGKPVGKAALDLGKPSLNVSGVKRTPEHVEDPARSHHKVVQSQPQHLSRVNNVDVGSKLADTSGRSRQNEAGAKLGNGIEDNGESHKKVPVNVQPMHDSKHEFLLQTVKESKAQIFTAPVDLIDGQKDTNFTEGNNNTRKRRESSADEDSSSYSKYEKDAPELKGPIKDLSQYKEYVQEYCDKYDSYCSLNKILENYRNEFLKMGKDLEYAKGRDTDKYDKILVQLRESYHQCGKRHKRLKKIFIVLHRELKNLKQRMKEYARLHSKD